MIAQGAFGLGLLVGSLLGVFASMAVVFGRPAYRLWRQRMYRARLRGNARPLLQVGPARAYPGLPSEDGLWVMFDDTLRRHRVASASPGRLLVRHPGMGARDYASLRRHGRLRPTGGRGTEAMGVARGMRGHPKVAA